MSQRSSKMDLVKWTDLNDRFNNIELAENWDKIDNHNHVPGSNKGGEPIPYGGLANLSVGTENLVDESVTSAKIKANAVIGDKIVADAVTTSKVKDEAITKAKLADDTLAAIQLIVDQAFIDVAALNVAPEPWITPSLTHPIQSVGGFYSDVAFYKDPARRIWLRGALKGGDGTAFQLPDQYRPDEKHHVTDRDGQHLFIDQLGNVLVTNMKAYGNLVLDGISFRSLYS